MNKIKNLIYYCYFENSEINEYAKYNLELLNKYLPIFNGQKIVKIAVDDLTKDNSHLIKFFPNCDTQIVQNNKETRESEYFIQSIKEIKDRNSITFFAHNKGSKSGDGNEVIKHWLLSMYFFNLDGMYLKFVENNLFRDKTFSGIMRITTPCSPWVNSDWHYSGTFFWFNTDKLFNIDGWDNFTKGRFSVEEYPGKMVTLANSNYYLCSENYNFNSYQPTIWAEVLTEKKLGTTQFNKYKNLFSTIFQKYSIIIPTMWKCDRLLTTLKELSELNNVSEIILIDNTDKDITIDIDKVIHIKEGKNTYVNPAWNKGVRISKYDRLLILNDDIWFDWNILETLGNFITEANGIIGMSEENYNDNIVEEFGLFPIVERNGGWGCAMFMNKANYTPIPEDMLIWGGDDYLLIKNRNLGKQNFKLSGFKVNGEVSLTADSDIAFNPIKENDLRIKNELKLF